MGFWRAAVCDGGGSACERTDGWMGGWVRGTDLCDGHQVVGEPVEVDALPANGGSGFRVRISGSALWD